MLETRRAMVLLRIAAVLCLCCTASAVLAAPRQDSTFATPAQPSFVLTGTVVNALTGAPIPYALVSTGQNAKLSDQSGNFRFEGLPNNRISVAAHKPGFFNEQELSQGPGPRFGRGPVPNTMITLSNEPTNVTIPLTPEAVISGHVEDSEGEPLEGLPVQLRTPQVMNGRRMWQQQPSVASDEDGNFRIANLRPGTYYVEIGPNLRSRGMAMQNDPAPNEKLEVVPAEYYPGVRDISAATPLSLNPGQHASIEMGMKRVPGFRISGMMTGVVSRNGGMSLADEDGDNANLFVRYDSRTGRFQAYPVPLGSYRLRFDGQDADGQPLFADVPINVSGDIPELRVPVERAVNIPVEINTEFTKQNPGSSWNSVQGLVSNSSYGQVHLMSRVPPYQQFYANRERADSSMVIRGVKPGVYDVEVDQNGSSYVASITYGGINLLRDPLVISEGAEPKSLQVLMRDDGASVTGNVQMGDNTPPIGVLLVSEGDAASPPRQVWVNPSGEFRAQGIAPGDYEILAFDRLDGIEFRNREVLNAYLSQAAHVTLSANQQAKVTVDLIRTRE